MGFADDPSVGTDPNAPKPMKVPGKSGETILSVLGALGSVAGPIIFGPEGSNIDLGAPFRAGASMLAQNRMSKEAQDTIQSLLGSNPHTAPLLDHGAAIANAGGMANQDVQNAVLSHPDTQSYVSSVPGMIGPLKPSSSSSAGAVTAPAQLSQDHTLTPPATTPTGNGFSSATPGNTGTSGNGLPGGPLMGLLSQNPDFAQKMAKYFPNELMQGIMKSATEQPHDLDMIMKAIGIQNAVRDQNEHLSPQGKADLELSQKQKEDAAKAEAKHQEDLTTANAIMKDLDDVRGIMKDLPTSTNAPAARIAGFLAKGAGVTGLGSDTTRNALARLQSKQGLISGALVKAAQNRVNSQEITMVNNQFSKLAGATPQEREAIISGLEEFVRNKLDVPSGASQVYGNKAIPQTMTREEARAKLRAAGVAGY